MELILFDDIKQKLAVVNSPEEIKNLRGEAAAIEILGRRQGNREIQNSGALGCIRCDQRLAELVNEGQANGQIHPNGRPKKPLHDVTVLDNLGIDRVELYRCRKLLAVPEDTLQEYLHLVQATPEGELTIAGLLRFNNGEDKNNLSQSMQILLSHETVDYYTPPKYIEAARLVMGQIDLDPASCEEAQKTVRAGRFYSEADDGLSQKWFGCIWLNPPYSKTNGKSNQEIWAQKLIAEYQAKNVEQAVLLVKSALGYKWFEELWDILPACFTRERLSFIKSDGTSDGESKHGTALFYLGDNLNGFIDVFSRFGRITVPDGRYIPQRSR